MASEALKVLLVGLMDHASGALNALCGHMDHASARGVGLVAHGHPHTQVLHYRGTCPEA